MCVRLSNPELETRSAARTRFTKLFVAAGLVITGIDSEISGASAYRIQRSPLGLILELGCPTICFVRVILRGAVGLGT
eukprot:7392935-Pyramimonas_sp.AAC.1